VDLERGPLTLVRIIEQLRPFHLALQLWMSLGLLYGQSPLLSALQLWMSLGLLYGQSPLLSALQLWMSLGLFYGQSPLLSALQPLRAGRTSRSELYSDIHLC
jgi:hypothetical protein